MIYVTGDVHGEYDRFADDTMIKTLTENDYLIITGDFGFINSDKGTITEKVENEILDDMEKMPYTILFVDGFNENFKRIDAYPTELWNGGKIHRIRKNIAHLMRGQVFEIEDKKIFTMGGAFSDKVYNFFEFTKPAGDTRTDSKALPAKEEYDEAWTNLEKNRFEVDAIVTYTPPSEVIKIQMRKTEAPNGGDILPFLDKILSRVKYKAWYFGLMHTDMYRGLKGSPLEKYCSKKNMHPIWVAVRAFNV